MAQQAAAAQVDAELAKVEVDLAQQQQAGTSAVGAAADGSLPALPPLSALQGPAAARMAHASTAVGASPVARAIQPAVQQQQQPQPQPQPQQPQQQQQQQPQQQHVVTSLAAAPHARVSGLLHEGAPAALWQAPHDSLPAGVDAAHVGHSTAGGAAGGDPFGPLPLMPASSTGVPPSTTNAGLSSGAAIAAAAGAAAAGASLGHQYAAPQLWAPAAGPQHSGQPLALSVHPPPQPHAQVAPPWMLDVQLAQASTALGSAPPAGTTKFAAVAGHLEPPPPLTLPNFLGMNSGFGPQHGNAFDAAAVSGAGMITTRPEYRGGGAVVVGGFDLSTPGAGMYVPRLTTDQQEHAVLPFPNLQQQPSTHGMAGPRVSVDVMKASEVALAGMHASAGSAGANGNLSAPPATPLPYAHAQQTPGGGGGPATALAPGAATAGTTGAQPGAEKKRARTTKYRGVTFHKRTGRYEAHMWSGGKQMYLGGFSSEAKAATAFDFMALKCRGDDAQLNFPRSTYAGDEAWLQKVTADELMLSLRRHSKGFSRGTSKFRGVSLNPNGKWEARCSEGGRKYSYLGLYATQEEAARAYDRTCVRRNGATAVTNFGLSQYADELKEHETLKLKAASNAKRKASDANATPEEDPPPDRTPPRARAHARESSRRNARGAGATGTAGTDEAKEGEGASAGDATRAPKAQTGNGLTENRESAPAGAPPRDSGVALESAIERKRARTEAPTRAEKPSLAEPRAPGHATAEASAQHQRDPPPTRNAAASDVARATELPPAGSAAPAPVTAVAAAAAAALNDSLGPSIPGTSAARGDGATLTRRCSQSEILVAADIAGAAAGT